MNLPSAILRSQARFQRRALISGRPLLFTFAGPYTRAAATAAVSRPVRGTARGSGFASFGSLPSDLKQEKVDKWGKSFMPDGYCEFSDSGWVSAAETLSAITDVRSGEAWDVIYVLPAAFVEDRCRMALVRRTPVYNRLVTVRVQNQTDNTDALVASSFPCRLSPLASSLDQDDDLPSILTASYQMECPYVAAAAGDAGAGTVVIPGGFTVAFDPKSTVIIDDPSVYSAPGPVISYRVGSLPMDVGGDLHHIKLILNLK
ncbi:MAG: hypothetical protein ACRYFS_03670 [Janthinobacterium lividum]